MILFISLMTISFGYLHAEKSQITLNEKLSEPEAIFIPYAQATIKGTGGGLSYRLQKKYLAL